MIATLGGWVIAIKVLTKEMAVKDVALRVLNGMRFVRAHLFLCGDAQISSAKAEIPSYPKMEKTLIKSAKDLRFLAGELDLRLQTRIIGLCCADPSLATRLVCHVSSTGTADCKRHVELWVPHYLRTHVY